MSKPPAGAIRSSLRLAAALAGASLFVAATASAPRASGKASSANPSAAPGGLARLVEIPGGRKLYLECRGRGGPTVILVSGLGDAGDVWSSLNPDVKGPAVFPGVARLTRVCVYERPNTYLQTGSGLEADGQSGVKSGLRVPPFPLDSDRTVDWRTSASAWPSRRLAASAIAI